MPAGIKDDFLLPKNSKLPTGFIKHDELGKIRIIRNSKIGPYKKKVKHFLKKKGQKFYNISMTD